MERNHFFAPTKEIKQINSDLRNLAEKEIGRQKHT
jgi:hypothetical protein